ncbi:hypothetical protein [Zavarzinella formosa]|uniref:hypothetical protein n=1 Tax=Zavarzinella formosa TaxID=360055 RepID=UPI0002F90393|nr:hypothetical protein [Zavarzinella formosa]
MPAAKRSKMPSDESPSGERVSPEAMIRANVIKSLGYPKNLFRMAVMPLWGNNYRVNVVIGPDVSATRISHSYFVEADDLGNIIKATPEIRKEH